MNRFERRYYRKLDLSMFVEEEINRLSTVFGLWIMAHVCLGVSVVGLLCQENKISWACFLCLWPALMLISWIAENSIKIKMLTRKESERTNANT